MSDFDQNEPTGLELVFKSIDQVRVRMACDFLQQGGMEAFIFDDEAARMLGSTSAVEARLMVPADRLAEARLRLKQLGFA